MEDRSALVVEGGAMRGVFSAGVLDAFMKEGFDPFDLYVGVSAGACNIASHLAGQYERNKTIILKYSLSPNFINFKNFLYGRHFFDLDWLWDIVIKELRLDFKTLFSKKVEYTFAVTSVESGKAVYLQPDEYNLEDYLKATSSIPLLYRNFLEINSEKVTDGGIADPIPVIEAYNRGARRIMVLRSRKEGKVMKSGLSVKLYSNCFRKYPNLRKAILNRAAAYMEAIEFINNPPDDVEIFNISPPEEFRTKRITRDFEILHADYELGFEHGRLAIDQYSSQYGV